MTANPALPTARRDARRRGRAWPRAALGLALAAASAATPLARPAAASPDPLIATAARVRPSIVLIWYQIGTSETSGTGFVISSEGHILTSRHVVGDRREVTVTFERDGRERDLSGRVVLTNDDLDFAVVKIAPAGLPPLRFGSSAAVLPGLRVAHYGFPFGSSLDDLVVPSLKSGIVSAIRPWRLSRGGDVVGVIQIDATTSKGESGAPVFLPETGAVVGLLKGHVKGLDDLRNALLGGLEETQVLDLRAVQTSGVGVAVPIEPIRRALEDAKIPFAEARP